MAAKKSPAVTVNLPAQVDIEQQLAPFIADLPAIVIDTDVDYVAAGEELRRTKGELRKVEGMRKEALAPVAELRSTIDGWFKPTIARLELHEKALKTAMLGHDRRREAERRAEEARLRDEHAREIAAALQEADVLSKAGNDEQAEAILDMLPSVPVVVASTPKLAGIASRTLWRGAVTDFEEFLLWCIEHDRLDLIQVNDQAFQAFARQTQGKVPVSGARIWSTETLAARAG